MDKLIAISLKIKLINTIDENPLPIDKKVELLGKVYNDLLKIINKENRD